METNQQSPSGASRMTPEEYKKQRDKAIKHLKEELNYLRAEREYEVCLAEIEEAKLRRFKAAYQLHAMQQPRPQQKEPDYDHEAPEQMKLVEREQTPASEKNGEKKERKLKID